MLAMKNYKTLFAAMLLLHITYAFGQNQKLSTCDTNGLTKFFDCGKWGDSVTFAPPSEEFINVIVSSLTGEDPIDRNSGDENYLFPITVTDGESCVRIIVTANALYETYGKSANLSLNSFRCLLKKTLMNDDTLYMQRPLPKYVFSANFDIISYNYPDYFYFRSDPAAFIRHYFSIHQGRYHFCFDDEQACVVEQLYYWGILVSDAAGAECYSHFFLSQADVFQIIQQYPKTRLETKWDSLFLGKKTRCGDFHL